MQPIMLDGGQIEQQQSGYQPADCSCFFFFLFLSLTRSVDSESMNETSLLSSLRRSCSSFLLFTAVLISLEGDMGSVLGFSATGGDFLNTGLLSIDSRSSFLVSGRDLIFLLLGSGLEGGEDLLGEESWSSERLETFFLWVRE